MRGKNTRKFVAPVYAVEEPATRLYFNLEGDKARLVPFREASTYPATTAGRLSACARIVSLLAPGEYELVRVHA